MKKQLDELLTPLQKREAFRMQQFFPSIARGHGSQHRVMVIDEVTTGYRCNAKDCKVLDPNHVKKPFDRAAEFVIARDA